MLTDYPKYPTPLKVTISNKETGYEKVGTLISSYDNSKPCYKLTFKKDGPYKRFTIIIVPTNPLGRIEYPRNASGYRGDVCKYEILGFSSNGPTLIWHEADLEWDIHPSTKEELEREEKRLREYMSL